jgi:hypothetical protein
MKGSCLCGSVVIEAPDHDKVGICHCSMCRRWGGGPLFTVEGGKDPQITGTDHVMAFKSSDWAERGFCKQCGTHLYYKLLPTNQYVFPAGLFQDGPQLKLDEEIFIDKKPAFYSFANQTRKLTEAEVFAQFAVGQSPT